MKHWTDITSESDIDSIVKQSFVKPQMIFKDSTRCGISAHAKSKLVQGEDQLQEKIDVHYLDLLAFRSISTFIAEHLNVLHRSPQVILLIDGKVEYTASHSAIAPETILEQV